MIKAIIIDDEQRSIINLQTLIAKYCSNIDIIYTSTQPQQAIKDIELLAPDLLFLDIHMAELNGFELLKKLPSFNFEVIFVTAFDQYSLQAIKISAIDYLLKPIDISELKTAVSKATVRIEQKRNNDKLSNLIEIIEKKEAKRLHRIALQGSKEIQFIEVQTILYCESQNNYTTFFIENNKKIVTSKPIYEYEALLKPYGFLRCHQSYLVNMAAIKTWLRDGSYFVLNDNSTVPVAKARKEEVKLALGLI